MITVVNPKDFSDACRERPENITFTADGCYVNGAKVFVSSHVPAGSGFMDENDPLVRDLVKRFGAECGAE